MVGSGKVGRGDIFLVNLEPTVGSEQGKTRPVLVIQNNILNQFSPTILVAAITSRNFTKEYPMNVHLDKSDSGLDRDSTVMLNQIRTIDKSRLIKHIGKVDEQIMNKVDLAVRVCLDLK